MKKPATPINEKARLEALLKYKILDTAFEEQFDNIAKLASSICEVPISLVSLIDKDRQWFKSRVGLDATETPRDISFCGHAINSNELFYIEDSSKDDRFKDNPLVLNEPHVIFYAGAPIVDENGFALGTLCVIDNKPNKLNAKQKEQLILLSNQVSFLIKTKLVTMEKNQTFSMLKKLSENLPGFIYTFHRKADGSSCFPYASNFIKEIYEVSPKQVADDASIVFTRIHFDDFENVVATINQSADKMETWNCDYRVVLPTKGEKWVRGTANPEKLEDGGIIWHGYISDVTEMKNKELTLKQTAKMATLGEMAASIAHEINNPLAIIKASSHQALSSINRQEIEIAKMVKCLKRVEENSDRIAKIVRGLTFFGSKLTNDVIEKKKIYNILEETIAFYSERFKVEGIDLRVNYPKDAQSINVECRSDDISQVFLNLINNSLDAISGKEKSWIEISLKNKKATVEISVVDSGNGIHPKMQNNILNPFFTTKTAGKGSGLGLSVAKKIIEDHQGKIWLNKKSVNTCFVIEIPKRHKELKKAA